MKLQFAAVCASALTGACTAAYVSEAQDPMRLDWYREGIGPVQNAIIDSKSIYVATKQNVIASVSKADGELAWRRVLTEPGPVDALQLHAGVLVSLSDYGRKLNFWKAKDGALKGSAVVYKLSDANDARIAIESGEDSAPVSDLVVDLQHFAVGQKSSDQRVAVVAQNTVSVYGLDGKSKWVWDGSAIDDSNSCAIASIVPSETSITVTCSDNDVSYSLDAKLGGWSAIDANATLPTASTSAHAPSVDVETATAQLATAAKQSNAFQERLAGVSVDAAFGNSKGGSDFAVTLSDEGFAYVSDDGDVAFVREEGLSDIVQVEAVALDRRTAAQAAGHLEKLSGPSFADRLASQSSMLLSFVKDIPAELTSILKGASDVSNKFVHSIGKKVVIVLSRGGRVYGLDSVTGQVRWSRTTGSSDAHILSAAVEGGVQVLEVANGEMSTTSYDLVTGTILSQSDSLAKTTGVHKVLRVAVPAGEAQCSSNDSTCADRQATVVTHHDGTVTVIGSHTADEVVQAISSVSAKGQLFFQDVNKETGVVSGYVLEVVDSALRARELWSVPLGDGLPAVQSASSLEACASVDVHDKIRILGLPFANDGTCCLPKCTLRRCQCLLLHSAPFIY